jgi:hypothetical protein
MSQGEGQHALRHAVHAPANFCMAQAAIRAERVNDAERPTTSGMREHLSRYPIVIVRQTVAHGLRVLKNLVFSLWFCSRYHACAFFHLRSRMPKLAVEERIVCKLERMIG